MKQEKLVFQLHELFLEMLLLLLNFSHDKQSVPYYLHHSNPLEIISMKTKAKTDGKCRITFNSSTACSQCMNIRFRCTIAQDLIISNVSKHFTCATQQQQQKENQTTFYVLCDVAIK